MEMRPPWIEGNHGEEGDSAPLLENILTTLLFWQQTGDAPHWLWPTPITVMGEQSKPTGMVASTTTLMRLRISVIGPPAPACPDEIRIWRAYRELR